MKVGCFNALIPFCILIDIPVLVGISMGRELGIWIGALTGIVSIPIAVFLVVHYYRFLNRYWSARRRKLRETYRYVYRVLEVPTDPKKILKHFGAMILVGDYGWEAEPLHKDGLTYLQGLTPFWRVV